MPPPHSLAASLALSLTLLPTFLADTTTSSFLSPPSLSRPRFRYWLPDGLVSADVIAADIASTAAIGAGGVEFLGFYNYGGEIVMYPPGADWVAGGFGTPAFNERLRVALRASEETGMGMDVVLGPNQGQGVPAEAVNMGLQWDLISFTEAVDPSGVFNGTIPGWGTGELVAFTSAAQLSNTTVSLPVTNILGGGTTSDYVYNQYLLKNSTLMDQSSKVAADGTVELDLGATANHTVHQVFAFYQILTGNRNLEFTPTEDQLTGTMWDNGSFVVDHFDAAGAKVTTDFWDEYILNDTEIKSLLSKVGIYAWEDSIEIVANVSWSHTLPSRFSRLNGYSISPFLPLLIYGQGDQVSTSTEPGFFQCLLDVPDQGASYINDFHLALQDGYAEYMTHFLNWTSSLGLQYSAQPSYNLPLDMAASIPLPDAPETESLGFVNNIDSYRLFSGPAQLAGRNIISNEMGAAKSEAFRLFLPSLLWRCARAFVGGVNRMVIHGQAYTGAYYGTTWPGYVAFSYIFGEMWSAKQPVWEHGLGDAMGYLSRSQWVMQEGTPKVDVVIYHKESATVVSQTMNSTLAEMDDLVAKGWTYSYLSDANLGLEQATVSDGVLAREGPAWKAMVVPGGQNMTLAAVQKLVEYATAGLPVLLEGGMPRYYPTKADDDEAAFEAALATLVATENVHQIDAGAAVAALTNLGLAPNAAISANGTWYAAFRSVDDGTDYVFVLGDVATTSGSITVQTSKTPFWLDAWTGGITPVVAYTRDGNSTTVSMELAGNQTAILAFSDTLGSAPAAYVTSAPENILGWAYDNTTGGITAHIGAGASGAISTSSGSTTTVDGSAIPAEYILGKWTLTAEVWAAPANLSDAGVVAVKTNTTFQMDSLVSWTDITALTNASGVGYYTTTLSWPPSSTASNTSSTTTLGAYISLPPILHSARLYINDALLPPLDLTRPVANTSPYLINGENEVLVEVPTVMWNYVRSLFDQIQDAGQGPLLELANELLGIGLPDKNAVGLVGEVTVRPFRMVDVKA